MEAIKETVRNVLQGLEAKQKQDPADDLQRMLKKVFTRQELKHARLHRLARGVLNIRVDSSAWLYHFSLQKESLLSKIQQHHSAIKNIRFYIGETQ